MASLTVCTWPRPLLKANGAYDPTRGPDHRGSQGDCCRSVSSCSLRYRFHHQKRDVRSCARRRGGSAARWERSAATATRSSRPPQRVPADAEPSASRPYAVRRVEHDGCGVRVILTVEREPYGLSFVQLNAKRPATRAVHRWSALRAPNQDEHRIDRDWRPRTFATLTYDSTRAPLSSMCSSCRTRTFTYGRPSST
jgi:hypothetical protein